MASQMSSILRELEKVQDRLSSLPRDDRDEKLTLMARQDELRTQAARLATEVDDQCSTQDLLTHLADLRRRRDVLNRQLHSTRPGNQARGPGNGISQVEERIQRIRALLANRGIRVR